MASSTINQVVTAEVGKFQKLQEDITGLVSRKQTLQSQLNENSMVNQELELLGDDAAVFKLVGPVLLKQDVDEAKQSVKRRLEFIEAEMNKVTKSIQEKESQGEEIRKKVSELQMEMKKQAAAAAQSVMAN